MRRFHWWVAGWVAAGIWLSMGAMAAEPREVPARDGDSGAEAAVLETPEKPERQSSPRKGRRKVTSDHGQVIVFGRDAVVPEGSLKREVVVVKGDARVKGTVEDNVLVLGGSAWVDGDIEGNVFVFGGKVVLGDGASVRGDVVVLGGKLEQSDAASVGGSRFTVPWSWDWPALRPMREWIRTAVVLGRPMAPHVTWTWWVGGGFAAFYLVLTLLFPRLVLATADELRRQPVGATLLGLLLCLLFGPLVFLLVISVAGVLILPLVVAAGAMAVCFGKAAVCAVVGEQLTGRRGLLPLVFLLGAASLLILYMVPVVGFLVWGMATLVGFGAAALAVVQALGWETRYDSSASSVRRRETMNEVAMVSGAPSTGSELRRVGFWRRFLGSLFDLALLAILLTVGGPFVLLIWMAYHVVFWTWQGTTMGGLIVGIRIVRYDGSAIDFSTALIRSLACVFSALPLFLGFFWAAWDPERQAWHDRIAGTLVVRRRFVRD